MTVTQLRPTRQPPPKPAPVRSAAVRRRIARQRTAAYGIGAVALVLTGLSLSHLAAGVQILTHAATWNAWAMAVGIDLGFIGLECGQLCITTETLRRTVARYASPAIQGTLIASAAMNAFAFAGLATSTPCLVAAIALGISIPALIYVLTRVSVAMVLASV